MLQGWRVRSLSIGLIFSSYLAAAPEKLPIRISNEPLTNDTEIVSHHISDSFRIFLADYAQELSQLRAKKEPTEVDKIRMSQIESVMRKLLVQYDRLVRVTEIVSAYSIQVGIELPLPFLQKLPFLNKIKKGVPGGQATWGVTVAATRNRGSGKMRIRNFAIAVTEVLGANWTFGKPKAAAPNQKTVTGIMPAVVAVFPMNSEFPPTKMGDLQGVYLGGAFELPLPTETGAHSVQVGVYAKYSGWPVGGFSTTKTLWENLTSPLPAMPTAGMVFAYHGVGGLGRSPSVELDALWYHILARGSDGSSFRLPFDVWSQHATAVKRADFAEAVKESGAWTPAEIVDRAKSVQEEIKKEVGY